MHKHEIDQEQQQHRAVGEQDIEWTDSPEFRHQPKFDCSQAASEKRQVSVHQWGCPHSH